MRLDIILKILGLIGLTGLIVIGLYVSFKIHLILGLAFICLILVLIGAAAQE